MRVRRLILLLLVPSLLGGPAPPVRAADTLSRPEDADLFRGETVNLYFYQNLFFSFDMTIPGDWYPLASREFLQVLRKEDPGFGYSDRGLRESGLHMLMSISRYRPATRGPHGEFNPNITACAMDLSLLPGIKTSKEYVEYLKSGMKAMGVHPGPDSYPVRLGGTEFWRVDGIERDQELTYRAYLSTIRKGYGLSFQLTAGSKADITRLENILNSIQFE